jgi:hypothetical protein
MGLKTTEYEKNPTPIWLELLSRLLYLSKHPIVMAIGRVLLRANRPTRFWDATMIQLRTARTQARYTPVLRGVPSHPDRVPATKRHPGRSQPLLSVANEGYQPFRGIPSLLEAR